MNEQERNKAWPDSEPFTETERNFRTKAESLGYSPWESKTSTEKSGDAEKFRARLEAQFPTGDDPENQTSVQISILDAFEYDPEGDKHRRLNWRVIINTFLQPLPRLQEFQAEGNSDSPEKALRDAHRTARTAFLDWKKSEDDDDE